MGRFTLPACGMREAISRVNYMSDSQCEDYYKGRNLDKHDSMSHALELRKFNPNKFYEMVEAMKSKGGGSSEEE